MDYSFFSYNDVCRWFILKHVSTNINQHIGCWPLFFYADLLLLLLLLLFLLYYGCCCFSSYQNYLFINVKDKYHVCDERNFFENTHCCSYETKNKLRKLWKWKPFKLRSGKFKKFYLRIKAKDDDLNRHRFPCVCQWYTVFSSSCSEISINIAVNGRFSLMRSSWKQRINRRSQRWREHVGRCASSRT